MSTQISNNGSISNAETQLESESRRKKIRTGLIIAGGVLLAGVSVFAAVNYKKVQDLKKYTDALHQENINLMTENKKMMHIFGADIQTQASQLLGLGKNVKLASISTETFVCPRNIKDGIEHGTAGIRGTLKLSDGRVVEYSKSSMFTFIKDFIRA